MAPTAVTEDYYLVLEVVYSATPEEISRSYKRLALKLHPDRNASHDATEAFQLLGRAYETLKDEDKRRAYNLIYPSIKGGRPSPQTTNTARPSHSATSKPESLNEAAQIAALHKLKQERNARWRTTKCTYDSSIFELNRAIRRLELEIFNLKSIQAAEAAEEAAKNSWGTWLLSPIYKKVEDSAEEKARKDREKQERRIEKDMKERRLEVKKAELKREESLLRRAKEEVDAADLVDDRKITVIENRIWAREARERREKERLEAERRAKAWREQQKQREKQEREAAEALRKRQNEFQAEEKKRREEESKRRQRFFDNETVWSEHSHFNFPATPQAKPYQASTSSCRHEGWWPKVQIRSACPMCSVVWTYLLQCPGCGKKACPKCQAVIRPRLPRNAARSSQGAYPRVRAESPDFSYSDDYF